jgi:subtilisin-like proprotein convertase family protein
VESQEWWSPGDPLVLPPNIVGIATLIKYTDAARSDTAEAIAYNLLPEHKAFDWQIGFAAGGLESGIGLIAVPSVVKDLDGTGVTTELAIANLVPKPGFTDFGIYIYDQNGLLDLVCEKLNEKQVEYIDFDTWGYVSTGFKGSAVISAVFWEHDVFDDTGFFLRNLVGLAAVVVERTGTRLGEDVPGDESAGTAGIPFKESEVEDNEYFFDFEGPSLPVCPGVPIVRPLPGECPDTITFACDDCPVQILDLQTVQSFIDISANELPSGCEVADVDVLIDLTHTWNADLTLDLTSPDLADVPLFGGVCGATDNMQVILDDEAGAPIGSVCPPAGFQRYNTVPAGSLTQFEGDSGTGTWRLDVADTAGADVGSLINWELQFTIGQ